MQLLKYKFSKYKIFSKIYKLFFFSIKTYSRVGALTDLLNEQHLRQAMKILNILYTYSRDYEPYFIYWLLPFQLAFKNETDIIYDLAMYLDLFVKNLFPQWPEVYFEITQKNI
jgi:hypothetical protein